MPIHAVNARAPEHWTSRACAEAEAGCNLPAHLGLWSEPPDPDATCVECGEFAPDAVRLRLALGRRDLRLPSRQDLPGSRRASVAGLLSARATAKRLGVGRDTLTRLVADGVIERVPKGSKLCFRASDVEQLVQDGFTVRSAPKPTRRSGSPRRAKRAAQPTALPERISDLPY
jgi:excisionase family DNA binding protein